MITDIKKAIKNISPNNVINILLVLFGTILVLRIILSYFDYQEKAIDIKNETHTVINNTAAKTASEVIEYVTDSLTILGVNHRLAKISFDLKEQYDITIKIIVPPPTGIPEEKWNELNNTLKRVRYWIHDLDHEPNIPMPLMNIFIDQLNAIQHHTHDDYDKHEGYGHDHDQAINENTKPVDTVPIREYQQILNELDSPLWSIEKEAKLDKTYLVDTRAGTAKVNVKDLVKIYSSEQDTVIEHYITILRSKSNEAQYCNGCHGYEDGKPVLIKFYADTGEKIIQLTKELKKYIYSDLAWFLGIIFLGMTGSYFLKNSIKKLQRSKRELILAKKYTDNIIHSMGESLIVITTEGIIRTVNQAAIVLLGYDEQEILGKSIWDIFVREQKLFGGVGTKELFEKENFNNLETTCLTKDGRKIPVLFSAKAIHGKEDDFQGFVCVFLDITQRKLAEEQSRKLSRAVEQSPVSVIITNIRGNIEYVNLRFKQLTGYQEEEVLGRNPSILKSGNTHNDLYRQLWSSITSGDIWRGVLQNRKKNGELFWVSATICPIVNQDGAIDHYIAFSEDITHLREKEDMLTHAMKLEAVGRMTNGIAHDFRNLLTVILGNLQLLQEGIIQKDSELIDDALSAAHDGSDLIKRLLAFSRRKEQIILAIDVNLSLQDLLRLLQRMVNDNVHISLVLTEAPTSVKADPNRLESAILNLVTNAQDAMPDGGELTIATDVVKIKNQELTDPKDIHPGKYVTISITDNGIGMNEDTRRHALEAFYSTKTSGTGLGLSMVNDFITASGGAIAIESSHGEGTTITLWLPAIRAAGKYKNKIEAIDGLPTGTETILLVEDSHKVRVFANRILTHLGYHIVETVDATEAIEYIRHHEDIDLLFTDVVMPGDMDGIGLAKQACSHWPSLRVLLTTGMYSHAEDDAIPAMDYPLLAKPYTAKQLAQSIRNILDTGQLTD